MPIGSHVTTAAVMWRGGVVIPTGECSPGVRTPHVWRVRTRAKASSPEQEPGTDLILHDRLRFWNDLFMPSMYTKFELIAKL